MDTEQEYKVRADERSKIANWLRRRTKERLPQVTWELFSWIADSIELGDLPENEVREAKQ